MRNSLRLPVLPFNLLIASLPEGISYLSWMQEMEKILEGIRKTPLESLLTVVYDVCPCRRKARKIWQRQWMYSSWAYGHVPGFRLSFVTWLRWISRIQNNDLIGRVLITCLKVTWNRDGEEMKCSVLFCFPTGKACGAFMVVSASPDLYKPNGVVNP